jgi:solute carrier family 10 (sodium/bile acid cotransporter), member 7
MIEALQKRGVVEGLLIGTYRILRCQPLCKGGEDPVDKAPDLKIGKILKQFWFPIALIAIFAFAFAADVGESNVGTFKTWVDYIIAICMFLMSFSLKSDMLLKGALNFRGQAFALVASYLVIPLLSYAAAVTLFPGNVGMFAGIMIASAVPTTLVSASVYARLAGGNDGFSMVFTIISNVSGVVICPVIIGISLSETAGSCDSFVGPMILKLVYVLIVPVILGQVLRIFLKKFADRAKPAIAYIGQILVLCVVFIAVANAKYKIAGDAESPLAMFALLAVATLVIHSLVFFLCLYGGRLIKIERADAIALAFSGSQKTVQVGLVLATYILSFPCFKGVPEYAYATFPIIIYHAVQLTVDAGFIEILKRKK